MNGNNIFVDTNIVLYLLNGDREIANRLQHKIVYLSFITELELLGYKKISDTEKNVIKRFLKRCVIINITPKIKEKVIELKSEYTIKLPDALIAATAIHQKMPLLTADKGFEKITELNSDLYIP